MTKDGKENGIEDIQEMEVPETNYALVESLLANAFYASEKGKRDLALSESRGHRLASAYAELDELRDRLEKAEAELVRLGRLLDVIGRCANDEAFSIVFDKEER